MWNFKRIPSPFISAFDDFKHVERRCREHYYKLKHIGRRGAAAEISSRGLVPATIIATLHETLKVARTHVLLGKTVTTTRTEREVRIPIWVRKTSAMDASTTMSLQDLIDKGTDVWSSLTELRTSNLRLNRNMGHDYEWLAWGKILRKHVLNVFPYDGMMLHEVRPDYIIYSVKSEQKWVWSYELTRWVIDAAKHKMAKKREQTSPKRKRADTSDDQQRTKRIRPSEDEEVYEDIEDMEEDDDEPHESTPEEIKKQLRDARAMIEHLRREIKGFRSQPTHDSEANGSSPVTQSTDSETNESPPVTQSTDSEASESSPVTQSTDSR
ncbi:hypothetical protein K504DRAFT_458015 [Pleomassaria siparia CBS 279.74]|uniref:Uncharacterized protein n=1 Tax=Pleomassaria siparia CBS 279.74 TaxID=1314801 RepID=A0A6G1K3S2_9PLEO|nr:hypothetical protein K504DRAFT_458015 [Pleomassaria siparia CBS 279.74]